MLNIKILKHSRKIYDKEYEDTVNTQNEAFLSLHIRLNNQGLERHAEHYIFNWYIIIYISHCLDLNLNGKRPGVASDDNFSSYLIRKSGYG